MINYNIIIKKNLKNKYQNSTIIDKNFIKSFFKQRNDLLEKINLIKNQKQINNDKTFEKLKYYYKKKFFNNKNILKFYAKFESNLIPYK